MWLGNGELHRVGFRRRSERYWQCEGRFGLPEHAYISIFLNTKHDALRRGRRADRGLVEVSAFHVTFRLEVDRVHFYYHELTEQTWEPGGHTAWVEIERHGVEPEELRQQADAIASAVVRALRGAFLPRS
jgi:hypothetical protein